MAAKRIEPREQHIVPRVHLKWFVDPADPPHLQLYEKGLPEPQRRSINKILRRRDYYTIKEDDGSRNFVIESEILKGVEDRVEDVFQRFHEKNIWPMTDEERDTLAEFMAFQRIRVPTYLNLMSTLLVEQSIKFEKDLAADRAAFEKTISEFVESGHPLPDGVTIDNLIEHINAKDETEWYMSRYYTLLLVLQHVDKVKRQFEDLRWIIYVSEEEDFEFVTCDNPVGVVVNDENKVMSYTGIPESADKAVLLFPINPHVTLAGVKSARDDDMRSASKSDVGWFNQWSIVRSEKYVCARYRSEWLDKMFSDFSQAQTFRRRDLPDGMQWPEVDRRMMVAAFTEHALAEEFVAEYLAKGGPDVSIVQGPAIAPWIVETDAANIDRARQVRREITGV